MNFVKKLLSKLLKILAAMMVWCVLVGLMTFPVLWLGTRYYSAHDTPDPKFIVMIVNEEGAEIPVKWHEAQHANWVRHAPPDCEADSCLRQLPDGSLKYHDDAPLQFTESHYRIVDDRIEPIAFTVYNFGDTILQIILATGLYKIGKYGWARWRLRGSPDEWYVYHQLVMYKIKLALLTVMMLVALFWVVEKF